MSDDGNRSGDSTDVEPDASELQLDKLAAQQTATQTMMLDVMRDVSVMTDAIGSLTDVFEQMNLQGSIVKRVRLCRRLGAAIKTKIEEYHLDPENVNEIFGENEEYVEAQNLAAEEKELVEAREAEVAEAETRQGSGKKARAGRKKKAVVTNEADEDDYDDENAFVASGPAAKRRAVDSDDEEPAHPAAPTKAAHRRAVAAAQVAPLRTSSTVSAPSEKAVTCEGVEIERVVSDIHLINHNMVGYGVKGKDGCTVEMYNVDKPLDLPDIWKKSIAAEASNKAGEHECLQDRQKHGAALGAAMAWVIKKFTADARGPFYFVGDWDAHVTAVDSEGFTEGQNPLARALLRAVGPLVSVSKLKTHDAAIEVMQGGLDHLRNVIRGLAVSSSRKLMTKAAVKEVATPLASVSKKVDRTDTKKALQLCRKVLQKNRKETAEAKKAEGASTRTSARKGKK